MIKAIVISGTRIVSYVIYTQQAPLSRKKEREQTMEGSCVYTVAALHKQTMHALILVTRHEHQSEIYWLLSF